MALTIAAIPALETIPAGEKLRTSSNVFGTALSTALEDLTGALSRADELASAVALGHGAVPEAAIARAKADVALEVAAVAASRISGAISTLLQTQV